MSDAWLSKLRDPTPWAVPSPRPGPVKSGDLVVRHYERGDGPALFEAISADRDGLMPWMAWASTDHLKGDDSVFYVERVRRSTAKADCLDFPLGIFDEAGSLLGGTGFHRVRPELREAEIGYWIRGDRQRQGIGTRAIGALISAGLRSAKDGGWGFRRLVIYNAVGNTGSRRICERLGLRLEMRLRRERYLAPMGYVDMLGFAVLSDEWDFARECAKPGIAWPGPLP